MGMQGVICGETAERVKRVPLAAIRVWNAGRGLWRDGGKCGKSGYGGDFFLKIAVICDGKMKTADAALEHSPYETGLTQIPTSMKEIHGAV